MTQWRMLAGVRFEPEKRPASASRGMVVTNHPLASAAGAEMLAAGGNAVDAAIASLFVLTVVEPMMVGIFGGGMAHVRLPNGEHFVLDGLAAAPAASRPDMYRPLSDALPAYLETVDRANAIGASAAAVPGALLGWCELLTRHGRFPLADVVEPAIRHATRGFRVTPFLCEIVRDVAADLARDPCLARLYLPGGAALAPGDRLLQPEYAETLRAIARQGPGALHGGEIGRAVVDHLGNAGGCISLSDLADYRTVVREPVRGPYRGHEIVGPPPPSAGGIHVLQMLNILEGYDLASLGFGTAASSHLLAEAMKIAFADRAAATGDPPFLAVPVERLLDKAYAAERRSRIDPHRACAWRAEVAAGEGANTTHVNVADSEGMVVASTQTLNSTFGARLAVPGTGIVPNNYMYVFDPHPRQALSIAPGKRVTTSQAPLIVLKAGKPAFALGLPGGLRIFPSAMQAIVNLLDHGMSLQEAVEAPRIWTQGGVLEVEDCVPEDVRASLRAMGHAVVPLPHVGSGMNAIAFGDEGTMTGAACWRADGTPIGTAGGLARPGTRFWPEGRK
jgi:gamma-glutamyltranspeptidase/glutathione hydrolase